MSLRSVGNQLLQTASSSLLAGASTASVSFWVAVNSANNVTNANGVEIFGDAGGKFSATLSAAGTLRLQWSSNDGQANGVSTCLLNLSAGTSYHVASTWRSGAQQYFLNGLQFQPDTKVGSLGTLGAVTTHPFRLGSDQAGTDASLDEPTVWVGYALTPSDVANLLQRKVHPQAIAPASIGLRWSLSGADGVPAKVGDPGLADGSPNGLNLTTIVGSAPSYQGGDLTYVPVPVIGNAAVAPSGRSIVLTFQDGSGNPSNLASLMSPSEVQTVSFSGVPAGSGFSLSFGGQATASIPVILQRPIGSASWQFPTTPGHAYKIAASRNVANGGTSSSYYYEVVDNVSVVASIAMDGHANSSQFTDPGVNLQNGSLVPWDVVTARVVPSGSMLRVQVAASVDGFLIVDALRVEDLTAGGVVHYAASDPTLSTNPPGAQQLGPNFPTGYLGAGFLLFPQGSTDRILATGGAPSIQSALQALGSIGAQGITVADASGAGNGSYQVSFCGPLADVAQPLLTCPDASVTITRTNPGGVTPTLTITPKNGQAGPPIPLIDVLWGASTPYSPVAMFPLPQSAPAEQSMGINEGDFALVNNWAAAPGSSTSYSGSQVFSQSAGAMANFPFTLLPPGTYRFAATWSNASINFYGQPFLPSASTKFLIKDGQGNVLETVLIDQTKNPSDYTALGTGWGWIGGPHATNLINNGLTLSMVGDGQSGNSVAIIDAAQISRTSADLSVVIGPSDATTITTPPGWATTVAGALPAATGQYVAPPSPTSIMPAFVAAPKTAKIGFNVEVSAYYEPFPVFSNLAARIGYTGGFSLDSNGYPVKIQGPRDASGRVVTSAIIATPPVARGGHRQGVTSLPSGLYVMLWDGDASHQLNDYDNGAIITEVTSDQVLTGTTGNRRVYNIQAGPKVVNVGFSLEIHGHALDPSDSTGATDTVSLSNLRIYPPDPSDPTGMTPWGITTTPPKFHPYYLYKLQGARCLRFLDPLATNNNTWANLSHFKPSTYLGRSGTHLDVVASIVTIQEPTGDRYFAACDQVIQITTATPHGLFDGAWATIHGCGTASFSDGTTQDLSLVYGVVKAVDASNFLLLSRATSGARVSMTNKLSPTNGTLTAFKGTIWPIQDIIDLTVAAGASEIWFNVAACADVSPGGGVDQVFSFLAANLPVGVKVHVEHGNECWNYGFPTYYWNRAINSILQGGDDGHYQVYYANKAKAVHDRAQAMFAAAGRVNDIIYTYATFTANASYGTGEIVAQAKVNGARMDELAVGIYFDNADAKYGPEAGQGQIYNRMTPDHLLDFLEVNVEYGHHETTITDHLPFLAAGGYASTKMVCYEASPNILIPGTGSQAGVQDATPNFYHRQFGTKRHPRMFGIMLRKLQRSQDVGLGLWNQFNIGSGAGPFAWDAYEWYGQQRGTGDPSSDAINISDPFAMDQVVSELGGALGYWSSLVPSTTITTTVNKILPGRNGKLGSTGLPRGMLRPIH